MQKKKEGKLEFLDIPTTVSATKNKAGITSLVFQHTSSSSEYLVLIDRKYEHDHQARLFDILMKILKQEEANIERYFF